MDEVLGLDPDPDHRLLSIRDARSEVTEMIPGNPTSTAVLLLDSTWRIDRVIDAQRACELIVEDRVIAASAEIVAVLRSPSTQIEIPSVVARLGAPSPVHDRQPRCSHRNVRVRDLHVCQFVVAGAACERRADSVDHLLPRSHGGESTWTNLVAACRRHNGMKRDRTLDDIGWALRRPAYVPTRQEMLSKKLNRADRPEWRPFLDAR